MHAVILNKQQESKWDDFAYSQPYSSIHQTSKWAHFQSNVPSRDKYWIIALFDDSKSKGQILAGTVLIKHRLPKNYCWLYAPRGPLLNYKNPKLAKEQMTLLLNKIKEIAKEENAIFFRIDPLIEIQNLNPESSRSKSKQSLNSKFQRSSILSNPSSQLHFPSFRFSHLGYQPEDTLVVNLDKPENEILSQMKEKGRYNIRLSAKKGIKIIEIGPFSKNAQNQIEDYFKILQETLQRDKFYSHGIGFYKNMIEKLAPEKDTDKPGKNSRKGFAQMYLAQYNGITIAGIINTFYKDTAIYYYGASSNEYRSVMAPYLLQWHAMTTAKSLGCTKYDLLGIAPPTKTDEIGSQSHPWRGVTEFKRKFGGTYVKYLPPQEYAFRPFLYFLYAFFKKLRKIFK